jgi:uncharacterized membrane protein
MLSDNMTKYLPTPAVAIVCASPFVLLAIWNLWTPYSYWYDELISVNVISGTWNSLLNYTFHDVHPPLYLVILKVWADVIGNAETQTRALSLIYSLVALGVLIRALRKQPPIFVVSVTIFFTSCWLFPYYAQETRQYALLLLMATAATLLDQRRYEVSDARHRWLWYGVLMALSLTHYFGVILAGILLIGDLLRTKDRRAILERVFLGGLLLVWPVLQLTLGGVSERTGGNFWITSDGVHTTLLTFLNAVSPLPVRMLEKLLPASDWIVLLAFAVVTMIVLVWSVSKAIATARSKIFSLITRIGAFVGILTLIDLYTPMSHTRYYIVLLPAVALLFGHVVQAFWESYPRSLQRAILSLFVLAYVGGSGVHALHKMESRWLPNENWKGLAQVVDKAGICRPHCWFVGGDGVYYFQASMGPEPQQARLPLADALNLPEADHLPIIAAHIASADLARLREYYTDWQCLMPHQSFQGSLILLVPESDSLKGLLPCPRT